MNENQLKSVSKKISYILRHRPETAGITLDKNGYAIVDELLIALNISLDELDEIVATNNKKRFTYNEEKTLIRASQGHSISVDLQMKAVEPPEFLYHGTAEKTYQTHINFSGLLKMNHQHVHLSDSVNTARDIGGRHGKPIVLTVKSGKMYKDGHEFFLSDNGVWLTDKVSRKYVEVFNEINHS